MENSEIDNLLRVADLISNYLKGSLNDAESAELFSWVRANKRNSKLFYNIINEKELEKLNAESRLFDIDDALKNVKARLQPTENKVRKLKQGWVITAAASVLLCLAIGIALYLQPQKQRFAAIHKSTEIAPGGNRAILTLSNGKKIVLNTTANGDITTQANISIKKMSDGLLAYKVTADKSNIDAAITYNTISTPRGGQYRVLLADGTNVWLNASSSIKFPISFNASERRVQTTGEAYFEVAHDTKRPFRVESPGQTIEVLGTHFNVNAYPDEKEVKTTLLQGSVKINVAGTSYFLKPGEQSQVIDGMTKISDGDTEEAVAWKNKIFHFNDASIESVMRQLSRWYDVDINYEGKIPDRTFSGEISMNVNASQILDALNFKKIHYTIVGKTIVVKP